MDEMNYDVMGKEQLRAECREREIPYSKLNNDGMRAALRADDASHKDYASGDGPTADEFEATDEELSKQTVRQDVQQARGALELTDSDQRTLAAETEARKRQPGPPQSTSPRTRKGVTIEKDREERNGVKRPSKGGVCREVWDECDRIAAAGGVPAAKTLRQLAEGRNWNPNNALIEFYQWRKFNGITGRAK